MKYTATLIRTNGSDRGRRYPLTVFPTRLGRHPECEVILESGAVSREHAHITYDEDQDGNGGFFVEDMKSRNGTTLNGHPVNERQLITDDDALALCGLEFSFKVNTIPDPSSGSYNGLGSDLEQSSSVFGRAVCVVDDTEESQPRNIGSGSQILMVGNQPRYDQDRSETKLRALLDIGRDLSGNSDQVPQQILENLMWIFPQADCAYIFLRDKQSQRLELKAFRHRDKHGQREVRVSRSILETVARSRSAMLSDDVANDSRFEVSDSIVNYHINTLMAVPLIALDTSDVLGVMQVDCRTAGKRFTNEDLELLVSVAFQVATVYRNSLLQDAALREQIFQRELSVASAVQRCFLPDSRPNIPGYHFFDYYSPAKYLGGDYYDYIPLQDGRLVVALGDVSGKGSPAALMMAKLSADVRSGLLVAKSLAECMQHLNRVFADPRWENRFITFFFGVLDAKKHTLTFFNAGHVTPILLNPDASFTLLEDKVGLPLGVMDDTEYEETTIEFKPGQSLLVISDGFTDAMNSGEKYWGMKGILGFVRQMKNQHADALGDKFIAAAKAFAGRTPQTDDQSMLIVGRDGAT